MALIGKLKCGAVANRNHPLPRREPGEGDTK